jgi:hypothetical protein
VNDARKALCPALTIYQEARRRGEGQPTNLAMNPLRTAVSEEPAAAITSCAASRKAVDGSISVFLPCGHFVHCASRSVSKSGRQKRQSTARPDQILIATLRIDHSRPEDMLSYHQMI